MKEAFEKILERLEELKLPFPDECPSYYGNTNKLLDAAKQIVQEVAEEYNGGWIPCSERLPEPYQKVIVSYMDSYIGGIYDVCEGQYVYSLHIWDISDYMSDDDFKVLAWKPLPEPFKERD